ncbi:uncharacterized protein LOC140706761, partial [Pogona vitticeps]
QAEPCLLRGAPSPTPSQLASVTAGLTSAPHSPSSEGRGSPAPSTSSSSSRSKSPEKKRPSKRKHSPSNRRREKRRRQRSPSTDSDSSHRRRHRRRRHRSTSSTSSSTSTDRRRKRHKKTKYIYISSSSSSSPEIRLRRRHREGGSKGHKAPQPQPQLPEPVPPPTPPTVAIPTVQPSTSSHAVGVDKQPRRSKRDVFSSDPDEVSSVLSSDSDQELPPQPAQGTLPEGEVVGCDIGDANASSPSEDFSSYSQMLTRPAHALKLEIDQPTPPTENLIFGDIKEKSPPPSLTFVPVIMNIIKEYTASPY